MSVISAFMRRIVLCFIFSSSSILVKTPAFIQHVLLIVRWSSRIPAVHGHPFTRAGPGHPLNATLKLLQPERSGYPTENFLIAVVRQPLGFRSQHDPRDGDSRIVENGSTDREGTHFAQRTVNHDIVRAETLDKKGAFVFAVGELDVHPAGLIDSVSVLQQFRILAENDYVDILIPHQAIVGALGAVA